MAEIKISGKESIDNYPELQFTNLHKPHNSIYLSPTTPTGLANRVQIDFRVLFCRRRRPNKNKEKITKDTFNMKQYSHNGRKYITG